VRISDHLKNVAIAGFLACVAPAAQAATVVFDTVGSAVPSVSGFNYTVTPSAGGILNGGSVSITQTEDGLGVRANPDTSGQLDGFPLFSSERLTVTFAYAVRLVDFTLGLVDSNDDVNIYINNVFYAKIGPNLPTSLSESLIALDINNVTSFAIEAVGEVQSFATLTVLAMMMSGWPVSQPLLCRCRPQVG
jgi:hypothetical protein